VLAVSLTPARKKRLLVLAVVATLLAALVLWIELNDHAARRALVSVMSPEYEDERAGADFTPRFEGADSARKQLHVALEKVASGFTQPTDIQFPPGVDGRAVVLEKPGTARWLRLDNGVHGKLFEIEVATASEEGLLGLAFHPELADNGRFFLNYVVRSEGKDKSRVAEWRLDSRVPLERSTPKHVRVLLEVEQPYQNHNGGQLAFGPDGFLYIGWGDGGFRDDPHGEGQNPAGWLGSMLRIDVDSGSAGKPYGIPPDNPFLGKPGFAPETYAYGLRNPWRYSFDQAGRLIVADVGQDAWEEVDVVAAGDNLGWQIKEGFSCARKDAAQCQRAGLVDPVFVYGREDGTSITGGFVYRGTRVPVLRGLYVFGDFTSGSLFAIELPSDRTQRVREPIALGRWPVMPSTFGRDHRGELYLASFVRGEIYRFTAK
jgi:glucose/arabinose dehydrogenase